LDATGEFLVAGEAPNGYAPSSNFVWKVDTQTRHSQPLVLDDGCFLARFSQTSDWLYLASESKSSALFHSRSWIPLPRRLTHPGIITDANFSHDGREIALLSGDREGDVPSAQVWDLSGKPVTPPLPLPGIGRIYFLKDGVGIICSIEKSRTSAPKGAWLHWNLRKLSGTLEEYIQLAHLLGCRRLITTGDTVFIGSSDLVTLWKDLSKKHPDWFTVPDRQLHLALE
jgi:hypothetical protein